MDILHRFIFANVRVFTPKHTKKFETKFWFCISRVTCFCKKPKNLQNLAWEKGVRISIFYGEDASSAQVLVLVITCLGEQLWINCPSAFLKILNCPRKTRAILTFSKIKRVIHPKNRPKQTCDYSLITPNQQTLCIETDIL